MLAGSSRVSVWPMRPEGSSRKTLERYRIDLHLDGASSQRAVREDIRRGLTGQPRSLPPKYFYDPRGSALFERISRLPEYYLTRVEQGIISSVAEELMERLRPEEVVELGPGSAAKVRTLLDAPGAADHLCRYVLFDINEGVVRAAAESLTRSYPYLQAYGVVADLERHLDRLPPAIGSRLVVYFGSSIGNLDPRPRHEFLAQLRGHLSPGDRLLVGVDLVKDPAVLEAAYNDPGGVTAEFNRNILQVVNRAVRADFQPEIFQHHAFYKEQASRIEMHLIPASLQSVDLRDLALTIRVSPDETIWTESSYKFTRESTVAMLEEAGLRLEAWYADGDGMFALALAGVA